LLPTKIILFYQHQFLRRSTLKILLSALIQNKKECISQDCAAKVGANTQIKNMMKKNKFGNSNFKVNGL
jgi:hypothetical protein